MWKMKRKVGAVALAVLYLGVMGAGSCGKKALQQIDKAKTALGEAKKANADVHAPKRYQSAEQKLTEATKFYDKYKFRPAEKSALESEQLAKEALEIARSTLAKLEEDQRKAEELARQQNASSLSDQDLQYGGAGKDLVIKDIGFDLDSDQLSESAKAILDQNAQWLAQHPTATVQIEGHCDERGSDEYNQALGAKRASAIKDYLIGKGVPAERLSTISYGESIPIEKGSSESVWSKNRRGHFALKT